MKRTRMAGLAGLILALSACVSQHDASDASQLQLYYLSTQEFGPALASEPYHGESTPESIIHALLSGPEGDALRSPYPHGLYLRGCILKDGCLTVNFSEHYDGLAAVDLTLADYCLTLTLCQLENVDAIEITVMGKPVAHRNHQRLTPEDARLFLNPALPSS